MSVLYHFGKIPDIERPDIVCYEKQATWGGLWNVTWRTAIGRISKGLKNEFEEAIVNEPSVFQLLSFDYSNYPDTLSAGNGSVQRVALEESSWRTDEHGEQLHNSQYKNLWLNGPKECVEYADYTFEEHFGKTLPSYLPGPVIRDYLEGRMRSIKKPLEHYVKFSTIVRRIRYHEKTDDFSVVSQNLPENEAETKERFTHIIVATGIFSVPRFPPPIPGQDTFPGRILHSHDFRDARQFKGQKLLLIGLGYSGEEIGSQTLKYGAKNVIISGRASRGLKWPLGISERPMVERFDGSTAYFKDGSSSEFDVVIYCTGYQAHYPFLPDDLRLNIPENTFYPDNLYKGVLWVHGRNNKIMYLGTQNQLFSMVMFDIQAIWVVQYITGRLQIPKTRETLLRDIEKWRKDLASRTSRHSIIDFTKDFIIDLLGTVSDTIMSAGDIAKMTDYWHDWEDHRNEYFCTFRDHQFASVFTGNMSPAHHTPWMNAYDDSLESFVNQTPNIISNR